MAWENINTRLEKVLKVEISFPEGTIRLPDTDWTIDQWLTSIAETDEELRELDIPRIRFLQNRWRIERLLQLEWQTPPDRRSIWAMYVDTLAYILFSDGAEYHLIAAVPRDQPRLFRAVIRKVMETSALVPGYPTVWKSYRPDLLGDLDELESTTAPAAETRSQPADSGNRVMSGFMTELLVGWIGKWVDLPESGFWHEEVPESITTPEKGTFFMKYKPTYGDKQRDKQKQRKEVEDHERQHPQETPTEDQQNNPAPVAEKPGERESRTDKPHRVA